MDRILPFEDDDISSLVATNVENSGVIVQESNLIGMEIVNGGVEYELEFKDGTKSVYHMKRHWFLLEEYLTLLVLA